MFAGEDSHQEFTAASGRGRASLVGELFGGFDPAGSVTPTAELEAAARTIFRAKNRASTGLSRLVLPVL